MLLALNAYMELRLTIGCLASFSLVCDLSLPSSPRSYLLPFFRMLIIPAFFKNSGTVSKLARLFLAHEIACPEAWLFRPRVREHVRCVLSEKGRCRFVALDDHLVVRVPDELVQVAILTSLGMNWAPIKTQVPHVLFNRFAAHRLIGAGDQEI